MKILLIDHLGLMVDFAMRCEAAGHEVRVHIPKAEPNSALHYAGKGLVTLVPAWEPSMKWAEFIMVSDNAKFIPALEPHRNRGLPLWGPNIATTAWELERGTGQRVLEAAGIETIPSFEFSNYDKAIEHVRGTLKRYVSKPSGDADKALSYVSKGPADMLFMLEHWKKHEKKKSPFLLQEFIPGTEMAVGGWFGRAGFSKYFLENFEFKKLMNDDLGVNTGEMGTAMKYCELKDSKLAQEMLAPLIGELHRQGYTGYVDVAVIIDEKGQPWPLEFTTRPGWPLFNIQQILHPEPVEWMLASIDGRDCFEPYTDIAVGVVTALSPFPYKGDARLVQDYPVWGVTDENRYYIHPCWMKAGTGPVLEGGKLVGKPMMVSAGDYLLVTSGCGATVSKAAKAAYDIAEQLDVANDTIRRTDIGCRLEKQLPKLQKHGYATTWRY